MVGHQDSWGRGGGGEWKGEGGILNINFKNSEVVYIVDTANNYVLPKKSYTP